MEGTHSDHGIIEWLGLEGTSRIMKLQTPLPPTTGRATNLHISDQPRLPRAPSNLAFNTSKMRDGQGIHSLSGQLFQHLTTLIAKNFPLTSNLNLPSFNFKPFPLVLPLSPLSKSCPPSRMGEVSPGSGGRTEARGRARGCADERRL